MRAVVTMLLCPLVYVMPLAAVPHRLALPGPWIGFTAMAIVLLSQSPNSAGKMFGDRSDRGSALGIFAAMIVTQLAAVLDFGFRNPAPPALLAPATTGGLALVVVGLALRLWAIRTLGRFFTSTVKVQEGQTVVHSGPYRILRHPSYTGALIASLGATIALASPLGAALVVLFCTPAYLYRIVVEEKTLVARLGDPYRAYRGQTWRLIPWIF